MPDGFSLRLPMGDCWRSIFLAADRPGLRYIQCATCQGMNVDQVRSVGIQKMCSRRRSMCARIDKT